LLDPTVPTLLIAECVLAYMDRRSSDALLRWLSNGFEVAAAVVYEMFGLDDSFGRVMRDNLKVCLIHRSICESDGLSRRAMWHFQG